MENPEFTPL